MKDPRDRYINDLQTHKCSECWDTGIASCSAIKPCPCLSCARRAMGIEPYSIWHDNGGGKSKEPK